MMNASVLLVWLVNTFPQVPASVWFYVLNVLFVLLFLVGLYLTYYSFRRAAGYHKFKGDWYSPERFQVLKEELYAGVRAGRLPDSETMALLDKHVYGKVSDLRISNGNGWL